MTMSALKAHPKVYWIWNHRRWCLENIPKGPGQEGERTFYGWRQAAWDKELSVVEKMQDVDPRNCESPCMNIHSVDNAVLTKFMHGTIDDTFCRECRPLVRNLVNFYTPRRRSKPISRTSLRGINDRRLWRPYGCKVSLTKNNQDKKVCPRNIASCITMTLHRRVRITAQCYVHGSK